MTDGPMRIIRIRETVWLQAATEEDRNGAVAHYEGQGFTVQRSERGHTGEYIVTMTREEDPPC